MNKLPRERRAQILGMMVEGNSIRAIVRMTGISKNTITKLLEDAGEAFLFYHDQYVRGIAAKRVQCDEIWSFAGCKQKNVAKAKRKDLAYGDVWTWVAMDADTKLAISYLVGGRDSGYAMTLMDDLRQRVTTRLQLTTDGHPPASPEAARRYSPSECTGARTHNVTGNPDPQHISTSYIERQNLTMRMAIRRFTRLTNAFSKKVENHAHSVAIHFMHYNFVRIHQSLRVTPAMAAGISNTLWSLIDMVSVIEEWEARHALRLADRLVG
jgi:IS1 family transposase